MTLASWFSHWLGFWDDRKCWFFFSTQAVLSKVWLGFYDLGLPKKFLWGIPPSRWGNLSGTHSHSHTNRRESKMGVKTPTSEGVWQLKKAYAFEYWVDTAPFFQKGAYEGGGNQRTKWNAGGDIGIGISTTSSQTHLFFKIAGDNIQGSLNYPFFAGHQT